MDLVIGLVAIFLIYIYFFFSFFSFCQCVCVYASFCDSLYRFAFTICPRVLSVHFLVFVFVLFSLFLFF